MTVTIKTIDINGKTRNILVREDGGEKVIYVECGNAAQIVNLERATEQQLSLCYGTDGINWGLDNLHRALAASAGLRAEANEPSVSRKRRVVVKAATNKNLIASLKPESKEDNDEKNLLTKLSPEQVEELNNSYAKFNNAVEFLTNMPAVDFISEVDYAKRNNNKFSAKYNELQAIVNADDAYCTAVINVTRKHSEELERKTLAVVLDSTRPAIERIAIWDFIKA